MRLTLTDDVDIRLDARGQPVPDNNGDPEMVSGMDCWMQDIWIEMLTEEGEILYEDSEGRYAYGFGLREFLNAEFDDAIKNEIEARIGEKLTKRDYIDSSSIQISFSDEEDEVHLIHVSFTPDTDDEDESEAVAIDIVIDGEEVTVK